VQEVHAEFQPVPGRFSKYGHKHEDARQNHERQDEPNGQEPFPSLEGQAEKADLDGEEGNEKNIADHIEQVSPGGVRLIPIVLVTAILPDGKPSGSISEAPFRG